MSEILYHLRELWAERARVGLVVLGVVWGTLSLTLLFAFGESFVDSTTQTAQNFGSALLRVGEGATTLPYRGLQAGRWIDRFPEDADAVLAAVPGVKAVALEAIGSSSNPLEYGDARMNVRVCGVTPVFGELRKHRPQPGGRFLNERDEAEHRRVVFLGNRTAARLFDDAAPVGETVEVWGVSFTVIGVLRPRVTTSSYSGEDRDKLYMPLSTFHDLFGRRDVSYLIVQFVDPGSGPEDRRPVVDGVFATLAGRYGIHPRDREAVWMYDHVEIQEMIDLILDGNRVFLDVVGVIGLLVALVGVANVTYVMVEERRREIGIQMALGARPRSVAAARLLEGLLVTLTGGVIGVAATAMLLWLLNRVELGFEVRGYLGYPAVSLQVGATVVALLVLGGALAGWWPARRAAALDPVVALREE